MMKLEEIRTVAVVGAGQMGRGIAQVCAQHGFDVALCDVDASVAETGKASIGKQLQKLVDKGKLADDQAQATLARIEAIELQLGVGRAQLVIEAATENFELKRQLFQRLDQLAPEGALLCSNTSSISITQLAAATSRPELVAGVHFMNPVPVMQLVELIRGLVTSDETHALLVAFGDKLEKTVVTSADRPGFIVNRVLIPMLNEACFALSEGVASIADMDQAITLGLNHPMGPFRLADWIGLDTVLAIAEVLHRDIGDPKYRPAVLLRNLVAAGHLGVKSGRGFYLYDGNRPVQPAF